MRKLVPVADRELLREHGVFFTPSTLRTWFHKKKYPFIRKVAGRLFVDLELWEEFINSDDFGETDVQSSA